MNRKILPLFGFLMLIFIKLEAHEPDHSYIFLKIGEASVEGRFEMLANDVNLALGTTLPDELVFTDVANFVTKIQSYLSNRVLFSDGSTQYGIRWLEPFIQDDDEMSDFIALQFELSGLEEMPAQIEIKYEPFFAENPIHRGILIIEQHWKAGVVDNHTLVSSVFSGNTTSTSLSMQDLSVWKGFWALIKLGMWHIWIGLDHILFLVALLLPAVVRRKNRLDDLSVIHDLGDTYSSHWQPVARFGPAAWYMLKIVTFFTIAHSLTLAIAALGYVNLSSRIVESIIAFSIALAAYHNIRPIFKGREWVVAFVFGLFHGFGFASVLGEKGLSGDYLVVSLLGFNVGVEIGQILIVMMVFPILYVLRKLKIYPKILLYGSILLIVIALQWCIERFFEVNMPFGRWISALFGS